MRNAELESGYVPGEGWTAAMRGHVAVLVPASAADGLVAQLWGPLGSGADLYAVLGALTRDHGLGDLPPFGIIERGERLRLVVRGAVRARVTTARGTEEVSGADVGTWAERAVNDWTGVTLEALGSESVPRTHTAGYPLADGAASAVALFVGAPDQERAAAPAPAGDAAPERASAASEQASAAGPQSALVAEAARANVAADPDLALEETLTSFETEPSSGASTEPVSGETTTGVTAGYDHLWEQTVLRRVEDAAVRSAVEEDDEAPAGPPQAAHAERPARPVSQPKAAEPLVPTSAPDTSASVDAPQLIQSVPWSHGASEQPRSITSELFGDHDGETILRSELETPEPVAAPADDPRADEPPADAPLVLGRVCANRHANPPTTGQCRVCGVALVGEAKQVPRPGLGRVRFANGDVVELVEPLVVGRQPSVSRVPSGGMPRLVTVESPSGDISRNHLEVRLEGWHVMVRDLKATNGTVIEREGQPARRLGQGELAIVLDGDVVDLGDGVTLRFEDIP